VFEGYLVGTSRGYERAEIRFDDAADIFEMRRLLEPRAAGSVASRLSKDAIAQLTTAFETAGQTIESDITQFVDAHRRFRNTWLSEVPNRRLARAIERYGDLTDHIRQLTLSHQEARRPALDFLSSAFDAFKSHDGMRAHDCVARQIDTGWEFYCELVRLDHHAENAA
jgi:DNA-binding GntR family transcriptional regulator